MKYDRKNILSMALKTNAAWLKKNEVSLKQKWSMSETLLKYDR